MSSSLLATDRPLSQIHDYLLMDLDGVCYRGDEEVPNAAEGLREAKVAGAKPVYLTNNSIRPPHVVSEHLTRLGIITEPRDVYTSSRTGVMQLLEHVPEGSKVLALGAEGLFYELDQVDLVVVDSADDDPDAVLQGLSESLGYKELSEAAMAIAKGAVYVATNIDATLPRERGDMLGNGSMVAAVVNATGVQPFTSGKPQPDMYNLAMRDVNAQNAMSVGDRLNTDIAGANAAGCPSLHVLTGVASPRDVALATSELRPTYLGIDLLDLNLPAPDVTKLGHSWHCGRHEANVAEGRVKVDGEDLGLQVTLDAYRAVVAAAWDWADEQRLAGRSAELILPEFGVVRDD